MDRQGREHAPPGCEPGTKPATGHGLESAERNLGVSAGAEEAGAEASTTKGACAADGYTDNSATTAANTSAEAGTETAAGSSDDATT